MEVAARRAEEVVSRFYVLSNRERRDFMHEIRTLSELDSSEITDSALAQLLCYSVRREVGTRVVAERDLYRICLQDHRILDRSRSYRSIPLPAILLYVLTHEFVHVVRFSQRLQTLDLSPALRQAEELRVDQTARRILTDVDAPGISDVLTYFPALDS